MSNLVTVKHIEHEIQSLPPIDQVELLKRMIRRLKHSLPKQFRTQTTINSRQITAQINKIYSAESSTLEPCLMNAQLKSIERDTW
jgi:hypothetical protein